MSSRGHQPMECTPRPGHCHLKGAVSFLGHVFNIFSGVFCLLVSYFFPDIMLHMIHVDYLCTCFLFFLASLEIQRTMGFGSLVWVTSAWRCSCKGRNSTGLRQGAQSLMPPRILMVMYWRCLCALKEIFAYNSCNHPVSQHVAV